MSEQNTFANEALRHIMKAVHAVEAGTYQSDLLGELTANNGDWGALAHMIDSMARSVLMRDNQLKLLRRIIPIGVALSAEKDFNRLLEAVVLEAELVTHADAGTLYLLEDNILKFMIVRNTSLKMSMGGTSGNPITLNSIRLHKEDGSENRANVASCAALIGKPIRIADAYEEKNFDLTGTKAFDARTGYHSKSFLAMPLITPAGDVIGVLQLINAKDPLTGEIIPFEEDNALESLVLLATAALDGYIREENLRREIAQLKIEIDEVRRAKQVSEITESSYFKQIQDQATLFRARRKDSDTK